MSKFFHSPDWGNVLEQGFGARTVIMPGETPTQFALFHAGPFCLAYAEFPIGLSDSKIILQMKAPATHLFLKKRGVHALRFTANVDDRQDNTGNVILPETVIENLSEWKEEALESDVRYKNRRARREGLITRPATAADAGTIFTQYSGTVAHHGGAQRYTKAYFDALVAFSERDPRVFMHVGETPHGKVCGFIAVAHDGITSYYLHGGFDRHYASLRPGYGLMTEAIINARDHGAMRFNLMASPADQPALVKFKEKWGGVTSMKGTRTIAFGAAGRILLTGMRTVAALRDLIRG
ncbi:MAG: GNAT family N-acetyltransferase [Candidatus Competibacteraceae bacterium]